MAKLVEILARELKEWPMAFGGTYHTEAVAQDLDGGLVRLDHLKEPHPTQFDGEDWSRECWTGNAHYVELSEDHATAIVTRGEWQAAVDALKVKESESEGIVNDYLASQEDRYVREWDGAGLPPVGTRCIVTPHNEVWGFDCVDEYECVVRGYMGEYVWLENGSLNFITSRSDKVDFRPIRTPEQIAAEEREKFIDELIKVTCIRRGEAGLIYDAGYRKQEQK